MDAVGIGAVAAGSIFTYAGIKGFSVPQAIQAIIQGKNPATLTQAAAIGTPSGSSSTSPAPVAGGGSAQAILQQTAAQFGWTGAQWQALSNVEMREAGFNPRAKNPGSGALGLAQALGHGHGAATAGTLGNQYGGFGLTDAQARAANSGDAAAQALWMCGYIKSRYGDPVHAWAHEQSAGWY